MDLLDIHRPQRTFTIFDPKSCRTLLFVFVPLASVFLYCMFLFFFLLSFFSCLDPPLRHSFPTVDLHLLLAPTDSRGSLPSLALSPRPLYFRSLVLCTLFVPVVVPSISSISLVSCARQNFSHY